MLRKLIYTVLIIGLLSSLAVIAQEAEETETPEDVASQVMADARELVAEARSNQDESFNTINTILGLMQVGFAVVTGLIVIAVAISSVFGLTSIRDLREEIESFKTLKLELTNEITAVHSEIESLQQAKDEVMTVANQLSTMNDLPATVDKQMKEQQADANKQMQALSQVQFAIQQINVGNRQAALNTLARANELQRDNAVINYFRGEVLVREGEYEEGIEYLQKAVQGSDMPDASATLAYAYRMMGDEYPDQNDKYYSRAENIYIELHDDYPELLDISGESVYGALAGLYRNRNMIDKAIQTYEQIELVTPNSSYPINNLGLLHFEHDEKSFADRDKGKEYFEKAKRKARTMLKLEGTDYWRLFDLITAEIALEETSWEAVQEGLQDIFDLEPIDDDIQKLIGGLKQLQKSEQPPKFVIQAMQKIDAQRHNI